MEYEAKRPVVLPVTDFLDLEFHLMDTRPGVAADVFVAELVRCWLAAERERLALRSSGTAQRNFQWKSLLLPDGTNPRTGHGDKAALAKVIGDHVVTSDGEGQPVAVRQSRSDQPQCVALRLAAFPGRGSLVPRGRVQGQPVPAVTKTVRNGATLRLNRSRMMTGPVSMGPTPGLRVESSPIKR